MTVRTALLAHGSAELYGSDRVFLESVTGLAEAGWRVVVTLPREGPLAAAVERAGARVVHCPVPVLRKEALRPAGFARLLATAGRAVLPMARLLRAERPDLVYVNTVTVPMWLPLARLFRRPVLAHVHEAEDTVAAPVRKGLAAPLLAANTIVVNSSATGRVLRDSLPRLEKRIRLVYNGVPGPAEPTGPKAEPGTPLRILLIGRISPRKGTDVAVEALALLRAAGRAAVLDVVGSVFPGWEWFERDVRSAVRARGLDDVVRWHGFRSDVWSALGEADIAIVPSRTETLGNTAIEAQLAGVPLIVTDVQGLPETVEHGRWAPVVPAEDPRALAEAIRALAEDWPATAERARGARRRAAERFAPERYRREIVALAEEFGQ
ncbi:glycosyltransferase family 4 protein [Amycolatopsis anabasis]|uniref:glycosyltransferase family 4 protein n=1 Tax=Amycolatopsis anabasis TaxID=1840409 RepID=UPI001FE2FEFF|nr:glycosyltransferase family 4 protein [Amycolatopsis anabasis]